MSVTKSMFTLCIWSVSNLGKIKNTIRQWVKNVSFFYFFEKTASWGRWETRHFVSFIRIIFYKTWQYFAANDQYKLRPGVLFLCGSGGEWENKERLRPHLYGPGCWDNPPPSYPGACFSKAPESFGARKAIFRSSVSKNGEVPRLKLIVWRDPPFIFRVCE